MFKKIEVAEVYKLKEDISYFDIYIHSYTDDEEFIEDKSNNFIDTFNDKKRAIEKAKEVADERNIRHFVFSGTSE